MIQSRRWDEETFSKISDSPVARGVQQAARAVDYRQLGLDTALGVLGAPTRRRAR
jgi:hypothetical protein